MKCQFSIFLVEWLFTNFQCWEIVDKISFEDNGEIYNNYDSGNYTDTDELKGHRFPNSIERPLVNVGDQGEDFTWRIKTVTSTTAFYDYDQFKRDYDYDVAKKEEEEAKLNATEFKVPSESSCEAQKIYNFGPITAICLISEYISSNSTEVQQESIEYLESILIIWFIIFSICFCCGWAHYGFLNILCPFGICFPEDTYEHIKQYLVLNPPGTKVEKIDPKKSLKDKTNIERVVYRASESEYFLYNNLWSDIYHV